MATRLRASDHERDDAVTVLREHLVDGRLDLDEFVARMERAQSAVHVDELDELFADLPRRSERPAGLPVSTRSLRSPARRAAVPGSIVPFALLPFALVAVLVGVALIVGHVFPLWIPLVVVWVLAGRRRWDRGSASPRRPYRA